MSAGSVAIAGAALALLMRAVYPRLLERREGVRLPLGHDGIIPGAQDVMLPRDGAPGVLLIHGGGDTPQAMRELAEHLHRAGYSVRAPLLARHGRTLSAMRSFDADEWREQVAKELDALRRTHAWSGIVGLSVGGALAAALAAEQPGARALVLLAPYLAAPKVVRALARLGRVWGPLLPYLPSVSGGSIRDEQAASRSLGRGLTTAAALRAFASVAERAEAALPRIAAPTLVIQSRTDNRISPAVAKRAFAKIGARDKSIVWTDGAGHVLSVDFGKERVFALTAEWLRAHGASGVAAT